MKNVVGRTVLHVGYFLAYLACCGSVFANEWAGGRQPGSALGVQLVVEPAAEVIWLFGLLLIGLAGYIRKRQQRI